MLKIHKIVPEECHLLRADVFLAKSFPQYSRNQWISWLKQGLLHIEGITLNPKIKLKKNQVIEGEIPLHEIITEAIAQDIPLNIVYEDEYLLIINKPQGLVVHPGAGQSDSTLMNALLHYQKNLETLPRAGIIHRLDKDTTGLLIIAKTNESYQKLVHAMHERQIQREYIALVHGKLIAGQRIETYFGRHPKNRLKMSVRPTGKLAVTQFKVLKNYQQNTLLQVKLETGRTHQIRVHLSHIHHPIVGDKLYGKSNAPGNSVISTSLDQFPRQALHAAYLNFLHPITEKPLTFSAELPDDFATLLKILEDNQ